MGIHIYPPLLQIFAPGEEPLSPPPEKVTIWDSVDPRGYIQCLSDVYPPVPEEAFRIEVRAHHPNAVWVGQQRSDSGPYTINRGITTFDTRQFPHGYEITKAYISIFNAQVTHYYGEAPFTTHILQGRYEIPVVEDDFWQMSGLGISCGSVDSSIIRPDELRYIELTGAGIWQINPGGLTKFAWRTDRDIGMVPPADGSRSFFSVSRDQVKLVIEV